jgi:hypothetical protein
MASEGITEPVEYLVTDQNNNKVAFSRFALLIQAGTPNDIVNASAEPFSLYLYRDGEALRVGMAVSLKEGTAPNFPTSDGVLPESMRWLLYPQTLAKNFSLGNGFQESLHHDTPVRYINVDAPSGLSFDFTRQQDQLIFANSKNALRAILDKQGL